MSSSTQSIPEDSADAADAELEGSPAGVHSSLTVGAPVDQVWQHLISARGTEALLGPGVTLGSKGESWHSTDGPHGVVDACCWHVPFVQSPVLPHDPVFEHRP